MQSLKSESKLIQLYREDNGSIFSPKLWFYNKYKIIPAEIRSYYDYDNNIIEFLKNNSELITFSKTIRNSSKNSNTLDFSVYGDNEFSFNSFSKIVYYFLYKECVVIIVSNKDSCEIGFYCDPQNEKIFNDFDKFIILPKSGNGKISILVKDYSDIILKNIDISLHQNIDLSLNYGANFLAIHDKIVNKLNSCGGGVYHFSGHQGTGKTSYIKYLTSIINREFIFIPITLCDVLSSPEFLSLLLEHKNAVLVIEDAEKIITSREDNENSLVSLLLNMADGILSSILNISIVLTHNTDKKNIDKALLRKGRLFIDYDFGRLSIEDSQKIIDSLKIKFKVKEPMSLAEIYNLEDDNNFKYKEPEVKKIGF